MNVRTLLGRLLGDGSNGTSHRCIRCGEEFDRNHQDCPSCYHPYVSRIEE